MTTQKYDYHCGKCGGLVPEPTKAYGYAGQYCHCPEPTPATGKIINTTSAPTTQTEETVEAFLNVMDIEFEELLTKNPAESTKRAWIKTKLVALLTQERTRLKEKIEEIMYSIDTWKDEDVGPDDRAIWEVYQYALSKINK